MRHAARGDGSRRCAACLAQPPRIARTRAAVAYGELSRGLAIRLKYGRKVAVAQTMARYMAPLVVQAIRAALLVPVPLHRTRLWLRGFNQSALVASELSRRLRHSGRPVRAAADRRTPPLKGMSAAAAAQGRSRRLPGPRQGAVAGKTVILIDDVLTTGSTAEACARTLQARRGGAGRAGQLGARGASRAVDALRRA